MKKDSYPEIIALEALVNKFKIAFDISGDILLDDLKDYPWVEIKLGNKTFSLFVNDEYEDFRLGIPSLSLCVLLRELECYEDAKDFLEWCKNNGLNASASKVHCYYLHLENVFQDLKKMLGKIDSRISDFDFTLNAGAARALRETKTAYS